MLPEFRPTIFNHEAELVIVIGKEAKNVQESDALDYVFGYTTGVDVSARAPEEGEAALPGSYGKSFDTFLPIGPSITTADEIDDPNNLQIRYWVNGELRQNYNTSDMEHSVAYMIGALSHVMTLKPGDLIMGGTNHSYLGPLQDGDHAEIEIESIGRNSNIVSDPLKRSWDPNALRDPKDLIARREDQIQPRTSTEAARRAGGQRSPHSPCKIPGDRPEERQSAGRPQHNAPVRLRDCRCDDPMRCSSAHQIVGQIALSVPPAAEPAGIAGRTGPS